MWSFGTFVVDSFCATMVPNSADHFSFRGHAVRHCATNRKVAGSIPDGVTGFFH
jgi:hypothetical protein